jgi:uncharacterized repeat protein (TIGR01451 family)
MFLLATTSKAQYVNIPDSNFRSYLIGKYPSCFNAVGQMDTNCIEITSDTIIDVSAYVTSTGLVFWYNISNLTGIEYFKSLRRLYCAENYIKSLPRLSDSTISINCSYNLIDSIFLLPPKLQELNCSANKLTLLSSLPSSLKILNCRSNLLKSLVSLSFVETLDCSSNKLINLPPLPNSINKLECTNNLLTMLPILPINLYYLNLSGNPVSVISSLPYNLEELHTDYTNLISLPKLPNGLLKLTLYGTNVNCLPHLPQTIKFLGLDTTKILCLPNNLDDSAIIQHYYFSPINNPKKILNYPICNPTNNPNQCQIFPIIKSFALIDANSNGKLDATEFPKQNIKLTLSNNNYSYTTNNGIAYLSADSLGTYTITATPPNFYKAVPSSYTHYFSTYDTLVVDTFALQAIVLKDSISIKLTPTNWAARAGRSYPYLVSYENVGTTVLSNAAISLNYSNSLLNYDSCSVSGVTNSGSSLSLNIGNLLPGQTGSFISYFTVKTTAVLNSSFISFASVATNTVAATDTVQSIVRGSYDPNDKQATPSLTLQEVSSGKHIDYNIRFQNTGTDTAFNVVIADTLDSKLLANQVQMMGSSHTCKTTVKDNIIFFEFLDIMLPDSNINKFGSNGFVSFKIKPIASLTVGTNIPNKAAIYFDYNSPVITKPANTIIQNPLPLQLLSLSAILQNELSKILVYWNTANEVNTAYFIIETSSNGTNFKAVAEVAAKGIGNNSYFYSIDKSNVIYVRLKMVDKDGRFTYSNIIKIAQMVELFDGLMVLKNPTKNQLQLKVISSKLNNTNASLTNAQGKVVKRFILKQGNQAIDISGIAAGVYYLQNNEGSKKVVVE